MSAEPKHITDGVVTMPGDAELLLDAMRLVAKSATLPRCERSLIRHVEQAHGRVIEAAGRVNQRQDEASLRLLDAALVSYQRRVLLMCVNRRQKGTSSHDQPMLDR